MAANNLEVRLAVDAAAANAALATFQASLGATTTAAQRARLVTLQVNAAQANAGLAALQSNLNRTSSAGNQLASGLASGLGLSQFATVAGVATFAVGALAFETTRAIQAAIANEAANRSLSASATQAGLSYFELSQQSKRFAEDAAISTTAAARATAELTRLAQAAGNPQDVAKYSKGFLDVAAARGVALSELSTLFSGILSGDDNALNRFGKADPSKLKAEFAAQTGKLVTELTKEEEIQSRLNAFQRDFILFQGANADRLASVGGQTAQVSKSIADLETNFGSAIIQNLEFRNSLSLINDVLKSIAVSADDVRQKLKNGLSPRQIAEEQNNSDFNRTLNFGTSAATALVGGVFAIQKNILTTAIPQLGLFGAKPTIFADARDLYNATTGVGDRRIDDFTQRNAAEKRIQDLQEQLAKEQDAFNKENQRVSAEKARVNSLISDLGKPVSSLSEQSTRLAQINAAKNNITFNRDLTDTEVKDGIGKLIATQFKIAKDLSGNQIKAVLGTKPTLDTLAQARAVLSQNAAFLKQDDFAELKRNLDSTFDSIRSKIISVRGEFQSFLGDIAQKKDKDNPFTALFISLETSADKAQKRFATFGQSFVNEVIKIEQATIKAEIASQRFNSQLTALKFQQEANRLSQFVGLTGDEQRSLDTLTTRVAVNLESADFGRQANAFRQANFFNPNNGQKPFERNGLKEVFEDVFRLRSFGANNGAESDLIAQSVLQRINSIDKNVLFGSQDSQVRILRDIAASSLFQRQQFQEQKLSEAIQKEQIGGQARLNAQQQLRAVRDSNLIGGEEKLKQFLAITGELGRAELTPELIAGRFFALNESAKLELAKANRAEASAKKMDSLLDRLDAMLSGKGIKVDAGDVVQVNVNARDFDVTSDLPQTPGGLDVNRIFNL